MNVGGGGATGGSAGGKFFAEFSQDIRRQMTATIKSDASNIHIWIQEEKDVIKEIRALAKEQSHATKFIAQWGKTEAEDLKTITEKTSTLCMRLEEAQMGLAERLERSRQALKDIKVGEEALAALHKKQREVRAKLDAAAKKKRDTDIIRSELNQVDREVLAKEAAHETLKREKTMSALKIRWNAWIEFSAKVSIIANFGNHLADQIPQGVLPPGHELPKFLGGPTTAQIMHDYEVAARSWTSVVPWQNFVPLDSSSGQLQLNIPGGPSPSPSIPLSPSDSTTQGHIPAAETFAASRSSEEFNEAAIPRDSVESVRSSTYHDAFPYEAAPVDPAIPTAIQRSSSYTAPTPFEAELVQPSGGYAAPQNPSKIGPTVPLPGGLGPTGAEGDATGAGGVAGGADDAKVVTMGTSIGDNVTNMLRGKAGGAPPIAGTGGNVAKAGGAPPIAGIGGNVPPGEKPGSGSMPVLSAPPIAPAAAATAAVKEVGSAMPVSAVPAAVEARPAPPIPQPSYENIVAAVRKAVGGMGVFVVCFEWTSTANDELSFVVGDAVTTSEVYEDGWAHGRLMRDGSAGFFPFNAVVPAINGLGEPAKPKPGDPSPESLYLSGSITAAVYRKVVDAICRLQGVPPPPPDHPLPGSVPQAAGPPAPQSASPAGAPAPTATSPTSAVVPGGLSSVIQPAQPIHYSGSRRPTSIVGPEAPFEAIPVAEPYMAEPYAAEPYSAEPARRPGGL
ncbi:Eisosome component PIL1-domain-containing protein [Zopfochytrium polystomum]|nr:Eisosome component PIL1-domain-containing protein [Zopfochytrium polystomum]